MEFLIAMGIPTSITSILVWWLKKHIDRRDEEAREREKNIENLMQIVIQGNRATNILAEATAKAVQRIPDARCNGDMTSALEAVEKIRTEEKDFMLKQGIKHVFGE